jgi:hypothetical protein
MTKTKTFAAKPLPEDSRLFRLVDLDFGIQVNKRPRQKRPVLYPKRAEGLKVLHGFK